MPYLLRVELPDVPGSLGSLAAALGQAGADIEAIEIVEHRMDGVAVDDVLLELPPMAMPDELITACHRLEGVRVHWISRYNAGVNLSMDLEAVEQFTAEPLEALQRLIDVLPATFRVDWAMGLSGRGGEPGITYASPAAPELIAEAEKWLIVDKPTGLSDVEDWDQMLLAACPAGRGTNTDVVVVGRHGGPAFLPSEIARIGHMVSLAASVQA
jgi:hypothetical protein